MLTRFAQKVLAALGAGVATLSVPVLDGAANADTWLVAVVTAVGAVVAGVSGFLKEKREEVTVGESVADDQSTLF